MWPVIVTICLLVAVIFVSVLLYFIWRAPDLLADDPVGRDALSPFAGLNHQEIHLRHLSLLQKERVVDVEARSRLSSTGLNVGPVQQPPEYSSPTVTQPSRHGSPAYRRRTRSLLSPQSSSAPTPHSPLVPRSPVARSTSPMLPGAFPREPDLCQEDDHNPAQEPPAIVVDRSAIMDIDANVSARGHLTSANVPSSNTVDALPPFGDQNSPAPASPGPYVLDADHTVHTPKERSASMRPGAADDLTLGTSSLHQMHDGHFLSSQPVSTFAGKMTLDEDWKTLTCMPSPVKAAASCPSEKVGASSLEQEKAASSNARSLPTPTKASSGSAAPPSRNPFDVFTNLDRSVGLDDDAFFNPDWRTKDARGPALSFSLDSKIISSGAVEADVAGEARGNDAIQALETLSALFTSDPQPTEQSHSRQQPAQRKASEAFSRTSGRVPMILTEFEQQVSPFPQVSCAALS